MPTAHAARCAPFAPSRIADQTQFDQLVGRINELQGTHTRMHKVAGDLAQHLRRRGCCHSCGALEQGARVQGPMHAGVGCACPAGVPA